MKIFWSGYATKWRSVMGSCTLLYLLLFMLLCISLGVEITRKYWQANVPLVVYVVKYLSKFMANIWVALLIWIRIAAAWHMEAVLVSFMVGVLVIAQNRDEWTACGRCKSQISSAFSFQKVISILFEEYCATCGHILTKVESVRFDKHKHPRICIQLHSVLRLEYRRKCFLPLRCIYSSNGTATYNPSIFSLILIRCSDTETQPEPISLQKSTTSKRPKCPECSRTTAKNHNTSSV